MSEVSSESGEAFRADGPARRIRGWVLDLLNGPSIKTNDITGVGIHTVSSNEILVAEVINLNVGLHSIEYEYAPGGYTYYLSIYRSTQDYLDDVLPVEMIGALETGTVFACMGFEDIDLLTPEEEEAIVTSFALRYHVTDVCSDQPQRVV